MHFMNDHLTSTFLKERMSLNFEYMIERIAFCNKTSKSYLYLEFVEDFIRALNSYFTADNTKVFLDSLVERILAELAFVNEKTDVSGGKTLNLSKNQIKSKGKAKSTKAVKSAQQRIGKCVNMVRYIVEHRYFSGNTVVIIEEAIKPLLQLMVNPN